MGLLGKQLLLLVSCRWVFCIHETVLEHRKSLGVQNRQFVHSIVCNATAVLFFKAKTILTSSSFMYPLFPLFVLIAAGEGLTESSSLLSQQTTVNESWRWNPSLIRECTHIAFVDGRGVRCWNINLIAPSVWKIEELRVSSREMSVFEDLTRGLSFYPDILLKSSTQCKTLPLDLHLAANYLHTLVTLD